MVSGGHVQAWGRQLSAGLYITRVPGGVGSQKGGTEQLSLHGQVRGTLTVGQHSSKFLRPSCGDRVSDFWLRTE